MKHLSLLCFGVLILSLLILTEGCKKEDSFLDTKPNQALAIPTSLSDLQLLVNNEDVFNRNYPALGQTSADDYIMDASVWLSDLPTDKNAYVWAKVIYPVNTNDQDWSFSYQKVFYANTILNNLSKIQHDTNQQAAFNAVEGSALFYRAMAFFSLLQVFSMPYDVASADNDFGIPLPLTPDLNAKTGRSTVSQCYAQIISDLNTAELMLPDQATTKTQPSKAALYALLSRIYLSMSNYTQALNYATKCLALFNQLQDFNKLNPSAYPVYPNFSPEEMFHACIINYNSSAFIVAVDSNVYKTFNDPNDLRKAIYFYNDKGKIEFNSQFDRKNNTSTTLSTDEVYLNKAECEARQNNTTTAMADLNALLITRWKTGTYIPKSAISSDDALNQILSERRKELVFTVTRWLDLRRLNKDPRYAITLYRHINGATYSLPPNDPRYALPIPDNEIQLNPMPQNLR